ncbi:hypothetical protein D6777_04465 [Candidatus Woesearchaeota archaeon]|nr:MAG: hypothetical protein D6777_04465 [Candidatus Woesearchaeota archaeon]
MQKKGQITIFVILGIIIVVSIVIVAVLKGGEVKRVVKEKVGMTVEFSNEADEVKAIVQKCIEQSAKQSFNALLLKNVNNYKEIMEEIIKANLPSCVDFTNLTFDVTTGKLRSVKVDYKEGLSKIIVDVNYDVVIKKEGMTNKISSFYTEIDREPDCCVPVLVDEDCKAKIGTKSKSCGRIFLIEKGESLKKDGECVAC